MIAMAQRGGVLRITASRKESLEQFFALNERHGRQVASVQVQQIENVVNQIRRGVLLQRILQELEVGGAVCVKRDHFAVKKGVVYFELSCRNGQCLETVCPILCFASKKRNLSIVDAAQNAIAVEFDF